MAIHYFYDGEFYADDTNYLITQSYVKCSLLAKTINNGTKTEHQVTWLTGDANNSTANLIMSCKNNKQ